MPHPFADMGATLIAALGASGVVSLRRRAAGSYVNGVYVSGAETVTPMDAVVQHAQPKDLKQLPENERSSEAIVLFTVNRLQTGTPATFEADRIDWDGRRWKVVLVEDWTDQAVYARAIAVREGQG